MLLREWPYNNTQNTTNKQKKHNKETKFDTADLFVDLIQKPYFECAIFITRETSKKILHLEEFLKKIFDLYFPFRRRNAIFKYVINSIVILTITLDYLGFCEEKSFQNILSMSSMYLIVLRKKIAFVLFEF